MGRCIALAIQAVLIGLVIYAFLSGANAESDLDRAYHVISSKTFVDLTHSFGPVTPVWSGFGQAKMSPAADDNRPANHMTPEARS